MTLPPWMDAVIDAAISGPELWCDPCDGTGEVDGKECEACGGDGGDGR